MKYNDKEKMLCDFKFGVKVVQKCAGEIQAKYNFNNFPSKLLICIWVKKFQATGSYLNNQTKLTTPKNEKKDCQDSREHFSSEGLRRATSLAVLSCASITTVATWGIFYELL